MTDPPTPDSSCAEEAPASTGNAPPFRPPLPAPGSHQPCGFLGAGERIGDFELLRQLGAGSFGQVYLARQLSLGRLVALKVSQARGNEARTLARLEHSHIVQVFSEARDPERGLRLLCMQYVPGTTLERVLAGLEPQRRGGRAILDVLDAADTGPAALDVAGLRERELLVRCDRVEAGCWLGARLAEALAHAHGLGVLHRDIKPANVLLNRYGRPFLADFNVSSGTSGDAAPLGGTLAYMAPEHLDAFASAESAREPVGERADLYSLGLVLFELFAGRLPSVRKPQTNDVREIARSLAQQRRAAPPPLPADAALPAPLTCVLRQCLAPSAEQRPSSAEELARALDSCRELRRVERSLPAAGPITRILSRSPFALGWLLVLLPHLLGSAVNITYNSLQIMGRLTAEQQSTFLGLVLVYNAIAYPACVLIMLLRALPVQRMRAALAGPEPPDADAVRAIRRRALGLPMWCVLLSCLGWLPGGIVFPLLLDRMAGGVSAAVFGHFLISFTISGLIALTYSFFALEYIVLRVVYPLFWTSASAIAPVAHSELRGKASRLGWFQFVALLIPLAAAALIVGTGGEEFDPAEYLTFRFLVTSLIALGLTGLGAAMAVSRRLTATLEVLTGARR